MKNFLTLQDKIYRTLYHPKFCHGVGYFNEFKSYIFRYPSHPSPSFQLNFTQSGLPQGKSANERLPTVSGQGPRQGSKMSFPMSNCIGGIFKPE